MAIGLESPFSQPLWFVLLIGNQTNDVFVQAWWRRFGFYISVKTIFIFSFYQIFDGLGGCAHEKLFFPFSGAIGADTVNGDIVVIDLESLWARDGGGSHT